MFEGALDKDNHYDSCIAYARAMPRRGLRETLLSSALV
jgi:hypothetical protein